MARREATIGYFTLIAMFGFKEFARMTAKILGYSPKVVGMSDKPAGVFARGGDTTKQASLGFTAKTTFDEGIRRAVAFYRL